MYANAYYGGCTYEYTEHYEPFIDYFASYHDSIEMPVPSGFHSILLGRYMFIAQVGFLIFEHETIIMTEHTNTERHIHTYTFQP